LQVVYEYLRQRPEKLRFHLHVAYEIDNGLERRLAQGISKNSARRIKLIKEALNLLLRRQVIVATKGIIEMGPKAPDAIAPPDAAQPLERQDPSAAKPNPPGFQPAFSH
jgi:hypothetical protein